MKYKILIIVLIIILTITLSILRVSDKNIVEPSNLASPFSYTFNEEGKLQESDSMERSSSPYWWLNSGGIMNIKEGRGETNQGNLSNLSRWRIQYNISNSKDTDNGYRPQNIFRLVTRSKWQDFSQEAYFKINTTNLSPSINRNLSNGILFFLRYQDGNNLYYAGLRVDGMAVIKKKINGEYFTLAQKEVFLGIYDKNKNPNLLPKKVWVGIKSEIKNDSNNSTSIKLFIDKINDKKWELVLETVDDNSGFDKEPILNKGFAGIRIDFMDVEFKDFKISNI